MVDFPGTLAQSASGYESPLFRLFQLVVIVALGLGLGLMSKRPGWRYRPTVGWFVADMIMTVLLVFLAIRALRRGSVSLAWGLLAAVSCLMVLILWREMRRDRD